jgi:hypothetical protein
MYIIFFISVVGLLVLRPLWPIVPASEDRWWWLWRNWRNEDWQRKPKYSEKTCHSATLSTTNPTWLDPGLNPSRCGGKPATDLLSYGAATSQDNSVGKLTGGRCVFVVTASLPGLGAIQPPTCPSLLQVDKPVEGFVSHLHIRIIRFPVMPEFEIAEECSTVVRSGGTSRPASGSTADYSE